MKGFRKIILILAVCYLGIFVFSKSVLFDFTKSEDAGNADWVIDDDMPVPNPSNPSYEDDWIGGISAFGVELAKEGYTVRTLTTSYGITYGDSSNPYDLSNFDVFVVPEAQNNFSSDERDAILNFLNDGGSLFIIADHAGADRDNDGVDAVDVWNNFNTKNYFGFEFSGDVGTSTAHNYDNTHYITTTTWNGESFSALAFHSGAEIITYPSYNSNVKAIIWNDNNENFAAVSQYGNGRIVAVGDSSPLDDGTGNSGNNLYDGWNEETDKVFFMNAIHWLLHEDVSAPVISNVSNVPSQPGDSDSVNIQANISDDGSITLAKVYYKKSTDENFTSINMVLDNGTLYVTETPIPAQPAGTVIEYYVEAEDNEGNISYSPSGAPNNTYSYTVKTIYKLIISEICDPEQYYPTDRFIEIYNAGNTPIDLSDYKVVAICEGTEVATWNLSGTINPGEALVCGDDNPESSNLNVNFPLSNWDSLNNGENGHYWNGKTGDGAKLYKGTTVIDDVSGAGDNPGFSNSTLQRKSNITSANDTYNPDEWTKLSSNVAGASDDNSTPGTHTTKIVEWSLY